MRSPLPRKVALVGGAARGAGLGIAAARGEAGATVVCTGGGWSGSNRSGHDRAQPVEDH